MEQKEDKTDLKSKINATLKGIAEINELIEERVKELEEKEKNWRKITEKLKIGAEEAKSKIKFDIGGKIFATRKETLLNLEGSYFHAMVSSDIWKPDSDGCYFIDRNPEFFQHVLDYLRTGQLDLVGLDKRQIDRLKSDFEYYQLTFPKPKLMITSNILNEDMVQQLAKMIPPNIESFRMVHDCSRGKDASSFDRAVKGLSKTLVIIESSQRRVFGAFIADTWGQGSGWIPGSRDTFLFALGNKPIKLLHSGSGNGIHISSCGLHLSSDLVAFCSHSCSPSVYNKVASEYEANAESNLSIAGETNYTPLKMEVFVAE
eukprot:TRINITY_DN2589_c0_g1_i1.p1 TRINITY_DN2589_c0_g1~~TRINITY_DN2589_c0_g1_i1.p1  ORF type:complete len:317 (-),score=58.78 TRINITY_DN2589_c0_g1_i1:123-1073(-)